VIQLQQSRAVIRDMVNDLNRYFGERQMRIVLLAVALATTGSTVANADDLADLKAQLEIATKSIQALQKRVQSLEAERARTLADARPARQAKAAAKPVDKTTPLPLRPEGEPVVAPNQKPGIRVPGAQNARLELYGAAQLDAIYDAKRVDPNWESALRPSKIPVNCPPVGFDPGCGKPGVTNFSIRQSTFGIKGFLPTEAGEVRTQFEIDLWEGADEGRITTRPKHLLGLPRFRGEVRSWDQGIPRFRR
jgi:hypothetical protein